MNRLYYGDNLDVLRRHVDDESVDLVYLDPPFNSNATYNVLFAERDGTQAASQIKAFEDTWKWDEEAARAFEEVVEAGGKVSQAMQAFRTLLGESDMMAYLAMMAPRLVELRRVLKPTGSLYLPALRSDGPLSVPMVGARPGGRSACRTEEGRGRRHRRADLFSCWRGEDTTDHPVGQGWPCNGFSGARFGARSYPREGRDWRSDQPRRTHRADAEGSGFGWILYVALGQACSASVADY